MIRFLVAALFGCWLAGIGPIVRAWGQGSQTIVLHPWSGPATPVKATLQVDSVQQLADRGLVLTLMLHNTGPLAVTVANPLYYTYLRLYDPRGRQVYEPPFTQQAIICGVGGRNYQADYTAQCLPLGGAWVNQQPVDAYQFYQQAQVTLSAHGTLRLVVQVPNMLQLPGPSITYSTRLTKLAADRYRLEVGLALVCASASGERAQPTHIQGTPLFVNYSLR
ncbi:hypothetical protein [Hymenobacter sp. YC55]|uniref:hypothetical protein n=1 Tax=Hymenobacter sp. YC55 TaxID=3034019 RepID=UPI0023F83AF9|nr:hypothetical protein [Hymenobacter sp. YC55]MDF7815697.1 hypothetical protein [Hymenobacter sp. YC55]